MRNVPNLICSPLYSIIAEQKVWWAEEEVFFILLLRARKDTRQSHLNACPGTREILTAVTATSRRCSVPCTCHGLPSVVQMDLGKEVIRWVSTYLHSAKILFVECPRDGTRQRSWSPSVHVSPSAFYDALSKVALCRVLDIMHSAKSLALGIRVLSGSVWSCNGNYTRVGYVSYKNTI